MKEQNKTRTPKSPQYCERPKRKFKVLMAHFLCHCLMVTQFVLPTQALAQVTQEFQTEDPAIGDPVNQANQQRDANLDHENQAALQGGLNSTCDTQDETVDSIYERIKDMSKDDVQDAKDQRLAINAAINNLAGTLGQRVDENGDIVAADPAMGQSLLEAQAIYNGSHGINYPENADPALIQAYEDSKATFIEKTDKKMAAEKRFRDARSARNACMFGPNNNCPTAVIQEYNAANSALNQANNEYSAAYNTYKAKRNELAGEDGNDSINNIEDPFFAKEQRYFDAIDDLNDKTFAEQVAEQEYHNAVNACDTGICTPAEQTRKQQALNNWNQAKQDKLDAQQEYNVARNAYRKSPATMANDSQQAVDGMSGGANAMADSHNISGCVPEDPAAGHDITKNTSDQCTLGGPLFDADENLASIASAGIADARAEAARRADLLFELELQREFAADYELYELAVNAGIEGEDNLDDIDGLDASDVKKTKSLEMTISNIKAVGAASAVVKDMVCEKHDESESDSKSYHVLRAAGATWLMAMVNDTKEYDSNTRCFASDELSGDENNQQLYSVERAALLHDQQLQSMCLRIVPDPPGTDIDLTDPVTCQRFGNWNPQSGECVGAERYIEVLNGYTDGEYTYPPLKERCADYYAKIRGDDYANKPQTREYARDMVAEALGLAIEELAAKRQKIATAYANVLKGRAWVKRVQNNIKTMLALAAVVFAAAMIARAQCAPPAVTWGCPIYPKLMNKYVYITGTVVAIWLMMELARAKKYLAEWEARLEKAKFFNHMACNFEDAYAEETLMAEMGQKAKEKKADEVEAARRRAIRGINNAVNDAVNEQLSSGSNDQNNSTTQVIRKKLGPKELVTSLNTGLHFVNNEQGLVNLFSHISKELNSKEKIKAHLRTIGLELMEVVVPSAQAQNLVTREDKRDVSRSASALNIAQGTESFRYFLVQRNQQYQNFTNDITSQPKHSPSDSEIAPASGNRKNINNAVIRTVDQLAAPYTGGDPTDPLAGLTELEKLGFPTPETRVATIQSLLDLFNDNIARLNGGIAEVAWQRDQYVQLLDQMRRRMKIDKTGLGTTQLIPNNAVTPTCMVGDVSSLNFDTTCGCSAANSCSSFSYPNFTPTTPNALKNGGKLSVDTANSLMSGNLNGAALNGGKLMANRAAVRSDLLNKDLSNANKRTDNSSSSLQAFATGNSGADTRGIAQASEQNINGNLANLGIDQNSGSALSRIRNSMLNNGANAVADSEDKDKKKDDEANRRRRSGRLAGSGKGAVGSGAKDKNTSENFSLTDGGGNLDLAGLTDEERARLGLAGAAAGANGDPAATRDDRYAHVRNLSSGSNKVSKDDPYYGIHKNRKKSLWNIISKRYEKTAFPVFLEP